MYTSSKVSIIIPFYNEEAVFYELVRRLNAVMDSAAFSIEVIFIDDGSTDTSADLLRNLSDQDRRYTAILLSRNFGQQRALSAGLAHSNATDAVFIMDGDLQDPPELLPEFYDKYQEGYDVVYAQRTHRKEGIVKRLLYKGYYRILHYMARHPIPLDSGDFGLMSKKVVNILNEMPEESRFLRGMRSWIGCKQIGIPYKRDARAGGTAKYTYAKLFHLAFNGIFNFSQFPIRFISFIGCFAVGLALVYLGVVLFKKLYYDVPEGYTSLLFAIILFSGVQLISIGILGEYILRIFFQVKSRPLYVIDEIVTLNERQEEDVSTRYTHSISQ